MRLHLVCGTTDHSGVTVWLNVTLWSPPQQKNVASQEHAERMRESRTIKSIKI